jgi:hypothetical protein
LGSSTGLKPVKDKKGVGIACTLFMGISTITKYKNTLSAFFRRKKSAASVDNHVTPVVTAAMIKSARDVVPATR